MVLSAPSSISLRLSANILEPCSLAFAAAIGSIVSKGPTASSTAFTAELNLASIRFANLFPYVSAAKVMFDSALAPPPLVP